MTDEILDLVDADDNVIGTINRKDSSRLLEENLGYIRASELFMLNDEGKLWIPVRTATKTIAPNGYDYSAAGHVESGDNYIDTIIRETKEEINLDISADQIELVAKMRSDEVKYFRSICLLRSNITPEYNTDDFVGAEWLTPTKLLVDIENGHPAKGSLHESVVMLQAFLNKSN